MAAAGSHAQTATTASNEEGKTQELQTIRVTGQKIGTLAPGDTSAGALGNRDVLSTPFSVNSLTRDLLVSQQAAYLGDFLKNDPSAAVGNVVISFGTLRGFSLGGDGFLIDGLALGSLLNDGRISMDAFERVDVLKGASAFTYGTSGSSSLGGAINYVPKTATADPVRDVSLTYTSRANLGLGVDLGQRFGDDKEFGLRVNAAFRDGETSVEDAGWRQGAVSAVGDWRVHRDATLQAGIYHVRNDFDQMVPFFIGAPNGIPDAPDTSKNFTPDWNTFNQRATLYWLKGDWSFAPDWKLTLQYGAGENERPYGQDMDTRFGFLDTEDGDFTLFASQESARTKTWAAQALVTGALKTGPVRHEISLGASATEEKNYGSFASAGVVTGSLHERNDTPQPALVPFEVLPYNGKTKSSGLFISDTVSVDERWSVLLGGRQAKIDSYDAAGAKDEGGSVSKFTPTVGLMFRPTASSLLYANYAQGLEPGGIVDGDYANSGDIMPVQTTKQYEIGGKIEWSGALFTAALFDMRRPLQSRDAGNNLVQEGDQVHKGVELQVAGSLTPDLRVVAGAMFLKATQDNANDPPTDGKRVAGVPKWNANLWVDYRVSAVPGLYANAGVYHADKQYFDNENTQSIPSWTRFDLGARYETRAAGKPLSLLLGIENVFGRDYWQSALGNALTLGDPRTVKMTARMSF